MFDWIQSFADWLIYRALGIDATSKLGLATNFFVYDTLKILFLLLIITFFMGIINSYFPVERVRNFLSRNKLYGTEYLLASTFGAITPFCSCSSVPLFIGFVKGGIPLGVTFAFLITSPLVNEVAVAIFLGMFGLRTTVIYVLSGIFLGVIGGYILGKLKLEPLLTDWVREIWEKAEIEKEAFEIENKTFWERIPSIINEALQIVKGVFIYVVLGIGVGAAMHGYIPEGFLKSILVKMFGTPFHLQLYLGFQCTLMQLG